jgi:hypothetical protein
MPMHEPTGCAWRSTTSPCTPTGVPMTEGEATGSTHL